MNTKALNTILRPVALLFTLLLTAAPLHATKIDGIYYTLNSTAGTAAVTYYSANNNYKDNSSAYSGSVVIPPTVEYDNTTYVVTSISSFAFSNCTNLTEVILPEGVTSIGNYTFFGCSSLTSITIPNSVTSIGQYAFEICAGLTSVTIGSSVISIGDYAYWGCSGLVEVTIPNSVTSIGKSVFYGCSSLMSVTIGKSVTSIGDGAFDGCSSLTAFYVDEGNELFCSRNGILYSKDMVKLILCPTCYVGTCYIPEGVKSIEEDAFEGCRSLTEITIPNTVASIGEGAFYSCSGLTEVTIPNSVTSIEYATFCGCTSLNLVTIGKSVIRIGNSAFCFCNKLTEITSLNPEPPTCISAPFTSVDISNCTLIVPGGSKEAYAAAYVWKDFGNIVEDPLLGVNAASAFENKQEVARYTQDGKRIASPQKGVNIIRYSDGITKKVIVR